jgi:hypothetical protein
LQTLDCSGLRLRINDSSGYSATRSISTMAPTLRVGSVSPKMQNWQRLYHRVASCSLPLYNLPNGRWAHRFLTTLTNLWVGVIQRRWNLERPLVFQVVILRRVHGITRFHDVKPVVWGWLDAWDAGRYVALVKEVEEAYLDSGGGGRRVEV